MRVTVALLLALLALPGCGGAQETQLPARQLRIATGSAGGVYAAYGKGLAAVVQRHLPTLRASALNSDGSLSNLRRLQARQAEVGFSQADSAAEALQGSGRFTEPVQIAALAHLYDEFLQVVVRGDSGIGQTADLAGRRVSIGAPGSGTALIAERVLSIANLRGTRAVRRRELDVDRSAAALESGRIDAFFFSGGLPTPRIDRLRATVPIRLIDLSGIAARLNRRHGDRYREARIPKTAYGARGAVTTVSVANLLVVRRDLDDETAYRLTRLLFDHHDELKRAHPEAARLNPRAALAVYPLPLHPGAARAFRDEAQP